jgi:putative ABC transport system permease protein
MVRSYLKIAFRFLLKNKTFSFINIIGLALGTICCLYILLYVKEQYSYDRHHKNANDIYRVNSLITLPGDSKHTNATTSPPIAPALKNDFKEVTEFTRVVGTIGVKQHLLRFNEKSIYENSGIYVDSTFFDVFTYHFVRGTQEKVLASPYSIVLLKSTADKLFGKEDPLDKIIEIDNAYGNHDFKVTGVVDERLGRTHIHANMFLTMNSNGMGEYTRSNQTWAGNNYAYSYIKLNSNTNVALLEKKFPAFLQKYGQDQLKTMGMEKKLMLQPVTSIHTTTGFEVEMEKPASSSFLLILIGIAVLIQLIACINFMNLSTARASQRAKEVGVRKVIGAGRMDLIRQFIGESMMLSLIGVMIALPLLILLLPYLNTITHAEIGSAFLSDISVWISLFCLVLVTGMIAGSYPAFYLSAFQAIKVIKGNFTNHISAAGLRRSLVVFQFVLSIVMITGIIIIYSQLNYIKNKDLGFEKDQKLIFSFHTNEAKNKAGAFINVLKEMPELKAVSKANNYPSQFIFNDIGVYLSGGNMTNSENTNFIMTDENFVKATGIKLLAGRDFRLYDSSRVLINETLMKKLGLTPQNAIGTKVFSKYDELLSFEIAGVIRDFNFNSLHENVKPFMLLYDADARASYPNIIVNTSSKNYKTLLAKIGAAWQQHFPSIPFEYVFLDDQVQQLYETENILANIINSFTLMAIFISCLGLFGLAAFSAEQRNKEIGIRKVLGASIPGIVQLLSKDFLKLVLISILISIPIAWWTMHKWLEGFAYRVAISWWMFAIAGMLAVLIAMCTVSFQAIRAAISNPVKSLRTE